MKEIKVKLLFKVKDECEKAIKKLLVESLKNDFLEKGESVEILSIENQ
jgi:hypothetical protein